MLHRNHCSPCLFGQMREGEIPPPVATVLSSSEAAELPASPREHSTFAPHTLAFPFIHRDAGTVLEGCSSQECRTSPLIYRKASASLESLGPQTTKSNLDSLLLGRPGVRLKSAKENLSLVIYDKAKILETSLKEMFQDQDLNSVSLALLKALTVLRLY